jgi:hypothetical protein
MESEFKKTEGKIERFENLIAWQKARELTKKMRS